MRNSISLSKYEELNARLLLLLKDLWNRVIFLDMETDVRDENFLRNERILLISMARRVSGYLSLNGVEVKSFVLESYSDSGEFELLVKFDRELSKIRPLAVVGFGLRSYDIPLLAIKKERYNGHRNLWKIVDLVEQALHIDLCHILRYYFQVKRFEEIYLHEDFSDLPLRRAKSMVSDLSRTEKGHHIYNLWVRDKEKLREYCEGEVFDMLLVTERLIELLARKER